MLSLAAVLPLGVLIAQVPLDPCPSPAMIDAALSQLGLDPQMGGFSVSVDVEPSGQMQVRIEDGHAQILLSRSLPSPTACVERARAAAIVAHAFMATRDLPSEAGPLEPSLSIANKAQPLEAKPPVDAHLPASEPLRPWTLGLGVGLLALVAPGADQVNPGLGGGLTVTARPSPWWGVLGRTFFTGRRALPLDGGGLPNTAEASWQRLAFGLGPSFVWSTAWGSLFAGTQGLMAFTTVAGQGLATNRNDSAWVPGAMATTGVDLPVRGPLRTTLESGLIFWGGRDRLTLNGADTGLSLPRVEALLMLTVVLQPSPSP